MKKLNALLLALCLIGLITLTTSTVAFAQQAQPAAAQGEKQDPAQERKAYDALNACIAEKDYAKKLAMAKDALGLYPKSQYAPYLKDQILQARGNLMLQAMKENKPEDAFNLGGEALSEDPENLFFLLKLSEYSAVLAKGAKNYNFADKGTEYAKKSMTLINGGKKPAGVEDAKWNESKPAVLASLHQSVGLFLLKAKKDDEALVEFTESIKSDCSDPVTHYLIGQVHNNKYEALGNEYRALPDDQKTGDAGKAVLEKINTVVDQILEAYAKMMVVSEGKTNYEGLRGNVKGGMEELYKFRHDGKADGLQGFIDGFKGACGPK